MNKMESRGIIFDLDGTLVDSIEDLGNAANMLFRRHGYAERTIPEYINWIGNGASIFIEQSLGSVIEPERLKDYVIEFRQIYYENLATNTKLYPGISGLLDELTARNIPMAVLSNKPHLHTLRMAEIYLSGWPMELVIGQREEKPRKPDPTVPLEMAESMGIAPGNILFVGDSAGDMKTAMRAGMIPVGVSWGYGNLSKNDPEQYSVLDAPGELLEHL